MTSATICILIAIVVYLVLMLYIGVRFAKKNNNADDFYLGGRKLGPLVTAMSAEASDMSSYLLMGLPGLAYLTGICDVGWTVIGLAVGTYLNWLIVAKRIRRYSALTDSITAPEFFSKRFGDDKNLLRAFAALVIIVFFVPYTASGFARDEKSRTFSSNSKRSHILRTSSRSIRLILSSIVSFAVWLKCTRTI